MISVALWYSLKSKRVIHPALFLFFLKIALAIWGLLWFHINFRIICSSSVENGKCHGYFDKSEKAMAPHSSTLAWKIPWMEVPGRLQSMGSQESDTTERLNFHFSLSCIGEGNGNPLQCSCLENPRDRGDWWAAVYGVTQTRTRLKQLSSSSILMHI